MAKNAAIVCYSCVLENDMARMSKQSRALHLPRMSKLSGVKLDNHWSRSPSPD